MDFGRRKSRSLGVGIGRGMLVLLLFMFVGIKASAQTDGCYINNGSNIIYTDPVVRLNNVFTLPTSHSTVCAIGATSTTLVYNISNTGSNPCTVVTLTGTLIATGVVRTYTILHCPLDNYLLLLFISVAFIGVFKLKKSL